MVDAPERAQQPSAERRADDSDTMLRRIPCRPSVRVTTLAFHRKRVVSAAYPRALSNS
jgi:hypothetical protein